MDELSAILNLSAARSLVGFWFLHALALPFDRLSQGILEPPERVVGD